MKNQEQELIIFTKVADEMPPKTEQFDKYPVSKNLIFRTNRNEFTGYYHYADQHWYTTEKPYYKGHWARRITNVIEWRLQNKTVDNGK